MSGTAWSLANRCCPELGVLMQEAVRLLPASQFQHLVRIWLEMAVSEPIAKINERQVNRAINKVGNQCLVSAQMDGHFAQHDISSVQGSIAPQFEPMLLKLRCIWRQPSNISEKDCSCCCPADSGFMHSAKCLEKKVLLLMARERSLDMLMHNYA